jgi:hypothetical protein
MILQTEVLNGVGKLLLDHQLWADVKMFVTDVDGQTGLSGKEKSDKVKKDLVLIFGEIGSVLLNFVIELGVLWLQSQTK